MNVFAVPETGQSLVPDVSFSFSVGRRVPRSRKAASATRTGRSHKERKTRTDPSYVSLAEGHCEKETPAEPPVFT